MCWGLIAARQAFWRCPRLVKTHQVPWRTRLGRPGARLRQAYGAAGPRPTNLPPSSLPLFLVCDLDDGLIFALRGDVDLGVFAGASDH
jgi:hypothetical protein